jgi:hypothetical protein
LKEDLDWWDPVWAAISCIIDCMSPDQKAAVEDQLGLMAQAMENRGDPRAANFCRALAGENHPVPKPKPKSHLRIV